MYPLFYFHSIFTFTKVLDNMKTGSVQAFHPGGFLDMTTGVFFHQEFSFKDGPIIGNKFRNFPA